MEQRKNKKSFFYVNLSGSMTVGDQFKLMWIILLISCALFTVMYIFTLFRGNNTNNMPSSAEVSKTEVSQTEVSQTETSTATSVVSTEPSVDKEISSIAFENIKTVDLSYDEIYNGDLILVNKNYPCHSDGENVESLGELKTSSYLITDYTVSLDKDIVENLNQMMDDFEELYGENDIMLACGYRSYENQEEIFDNEAESVGIEEAEQWVARPGYSEHQTGLAMDFTLNQENEQGGIQYDGTGIYEWVNQNSYKYGFVLRYMLDKEEITGYSYEPWHFRYVGIPAALYISQNHLTLEEYIDVVKQYDIDNPLLIDGGGENKWYTYYVPANENSTTAVPVPENSNSTISGDNFSGFIVTADVDIKG